jgi:hypothetical protein
MRGKSIATAISAIATTVALTAHASADGTDDAFLAELNRIGLTVKPDDVAGVISQAKFDCEELRSGKENNVQVAGVISELLSDNATKRQIWGALAAGVKSYCPERIGTVYQDAASQHLQLP